MDQDNRASPRIAVSIRMACAAAEAGLLRLADLSLGGFMARGRIRARLGDRIEGSIRVFAAGAEAEVGVAGEVVRALPDGEELALGVKILSFSGPAAQAAYEAFVRELYED
ncbi:MAG TPA: PilZ domain-containing protein [Spirochaetales bacterium]|nr:PilZ domain-containing protein [Spirochaetales bacterium]HRY55969.1 PilZ domain-containing protein [Spirochaetia bacterium]HRZ63911.1 PilZ domain-containing protein [Spirochaetia bacterium]